MKGKLIKENNGYTLFVDGKVFGDIKSITNRLSLKNCEAIERGYDLDELADTFYMKFENQIENPALFYRYFKLIFPKALEILGDKKYSEEDMNNTMNWIMTQYFEFNEQPTTARRDHYIQSLQQTEWDVEIRMEEIHFGGGCYKKQPKLDSDGCLILKGISK